MYKDYFLLKFEKLFSELDATSDRILKLESYERGLQDDCKSQMELYLQRNRINRWCAVESDDEKVGLVEGRLLDISASAFSNHLETTIELEFYIANDPFAIENISDLTENEKMILSEIQQLWQASLTDRHGYIDRSKYKSLCSSLLEEAHGIDIMTIVSLDYELPEMKELMKFLTEERQFPFFDKHHPKGLNVFYETRQELREQLLERE